ncbi:hypothetical protein CKM354_000640800 [Cercospora kikuchii]|uniref:Uncharacterized protein n=1 Tax=Cercospora kikuchii TaxID=84275 RepID=A0A9P3FI71_9PEZI|nr:uncharacterized protein CKM354_000640800 [Cercospora kikuchii]GIZ43170.1 hypothetical protein CKM354_000640800 [Cercospora kikuchii]
MSRFFPHTSHAEDQPYAPTLLWSHILYRGFQTGATLGLASAAAQQTYKIARGLPRNPLLSGATLAITGRWALISTALMVPATIGRMWGREDIEWRDRSWRLLENKGQKEVDDWSLVGTVVGAVGFGTGQGTGMARVMRVAGGAGVGSMVGVGGYMVWRYGMNGGKWEDDD